MSAPISTSFNKLSISQMQSSRANPKGKGRNPPSDNGTSSSEDGSEEDFEGQDSSSDEEQDGQARKALYTRGVFAIDHCRHTGTHYAFQMASCKVERHSIRISTATPATPSCSCGKPHCQHVTYLLERLSVTQSEDNKITLLTPYEQISARGFSQVCEGLHWELREEVESVPEETRWQLNKDYLSMIRGRRSRVMVQQRIDAVRDIMATMSSQSTDDYRQDIFDASGNFSRDSIFTKGDLEATVSKLLILDDEFFGRFQYLVSRDVRASDYFTKMGLKARDVCDQLDTFCNIGQDPGRGRHDLIWCAKQLCTIVASIGDNVAKRQPLSPSSREAAAKALVFILGMVVRDRNYDAYKHSKLSRQRPQNEPQRDRNLYLRLIGDPRLSPAGDNFILEALQDLPEAVRYVEELDDIHVRLNSADWAAPQIYRDRLSALINHLKSGSANASPSGTTSGKRPAGSLDRMANKRMK